MTKNGGGKMLNSDQLRCLEKSMDALGDSYPAFDGDAAQCDNSNAKNGGK
jgi:hypothetical protein